jgi:hypothetical protein
MTGGLAFLLSSVDYFYDEARCALPGRRRHANHGICRGMSTEELASWLAIVVIALAICVFCYLRTREDF